ncbi:MAG TPA: AAA family ATPase [Solirubrobacteraceae bacterium]|nr:AAA family ATPase [Solirubrobacteraceae bacterium]
MLDGRRADMLLEREPELHRMREAIRQATTGAGGLVVIGGPAGIGKTALLRAAVCMAEEAGVRVLRARATDLEQEFSFGVVRQLFEAPLARAGAGEREALLGGAAALAGPLFESGPAPGTPTEDDPAASPDGNSVAGSPGPADRRFTLVHSLFWLTSNISRTGPIALVVDDCHWADQPSLRFLAYASARCDELGVLVIVTVRDGEPSTVKELLVALRAHQHAILIEPTSLSAGAVAQLVRSGLGAHADADFCAACARASAGNPFLVRELIAELENEHVEPVAASASRVESVRPESVSRAVVARLNRLGADSRNLARSVAVLENATLRQAATLAGIPLARAMRAADRLISAQILAQAASLVFVHPVLQRTVYERIPAAALADGHRRAGLLLAGEGARSTRVGAHLLRGEPAGDPAVVVLLREAARAALADGAPQTAVRLLRRTLSEPPANDARGVVLAELGEAEALARDPAAGDHLREALELVVAPAIRVRLARVRSELLVWDGRPVEAHSVLVAMIEELGPAAAPQLRAQLEALRALTASLDRRLVAEVEPRLPALRELAVAAGPAGRSLLVFDACWQATRGVGPGDWREQLDAGLDRGRLVTEEPTGPQMARYAISTLVFVDEVRRARELIDELHADTLSRGSIDAHLSSLTWGALLALRCGELSRAEADAQAALELGNRHRVLWARVWPAAFLARAMLERGAAEAADRVLAEAPIEEAIDTIAALHALMARAQVRLVLGRTAEAILDLRRVGEASMLDNPNNLPWRSTLALAIGAREPTEARVLAHAELDRANHLAQPRAIGVALRACGVLAGGDDGIAILEEAVASLRSSPARLELARALCDLGAAQRRAGKRSAARQQLREAAHLAGQCGAVALAVRIGEELAATAFYRRRDGASGAGSLTPAERRVAELAASGLTNREIARALFVSVKTVGTHLGHIYEKLDLQGAQAREQLGARLNGHLVANGTGTLSGAQRG